MWEIVIINSKTAARTKEELLFERFVVQNVQNKHLQRLQGHSCNIGNAPNLVGKKLKTVICVFWMYIWYGITLTKMGNEMGKLKQIFNTYIWQNVWFFRPEEILTISCKIRCQSFNFICQALEQSLKFANRSYRLKEYICFQVFLKITFFGPICKLVIFFKKRFINSRWILFQNR